MTLAGRVPLDIGGQTLTEAARMIRETEPEPLGSLDPTWRGDVETIAVKAMANDREMRYVSASALADDLRRFLRAEPIAAHPPSTFYQIRKYARRNKAVVSGIAATVLALVLGVVTATWFAISAIEAKRESDRQAILAGRAANRASLAAAAAAPREGDWPTAERPPLSGGLGSRGWCRTRGKSTRSEAPWNLSVMHS